MSAPKDVTLIMIDLEAMSAANNAAILSIGASVVFPYTHPFPPKTWYCKIDPVEVSKREYCFDISPETMEWWKNQLPEAREEAFSGKTPVAEALTGFAIWLEHFKKNEGQDFILFGNGATFDLNILRNAYDALNIEVPWTAFQEHCYRTIKVMFPEIYTHVMQKLPRTGHHNALEDAKWQAGVLREMAYILADAHDILLWEGVKIDVKDGN